MTRGAAEFPRGDIAMARTYNPASVLLVPGALAVIGRAAYGVVTGRWFQVNGSFDAHGRVVVAVAVVVLAVRQQLNVQLLPPRGEHHCGRGAYMITATPSRQMAAPTRSHRSGRNPSNTTPHASEPATKTPP